MQYCYLFPPADKLEAELPLIAEAVFVLKVMTRLRQYEFLRVE